MNSVVTPRLLVGHNPSHLRDAILVDDVEGAVRVIESGLTAQLPDGAWDLASEVLLLLGSSESWAKNCVHYARTGEILEDF